MRPRTGRVGAQRTLSTLCALREAEDAARRCGERADRTLDVRPAVRRQSAMRRRCEELRVQLDALQAPPANASARTLAMRNFRSGRLVTPTAQCSLNDDARGVAILTPSWCVATDSVTNFAQARRVLAYLEKQTAYRKERLRASPHPAVPRAVACDDAFARLQNLPSWQAARIALASIAMSKTPVTPREFNYWMHALDIHTAYVPALRHLRDRIRRRHASAPRPRSR